MVILDWDIFIICLDIGIEDVEFLIINLVDIFVCVFMVLISDNIFLVIFCSDMIIIIIDGVQKMVIWNLF